MKKIPAEYKNKPVTMLITLTDYEGRSSTATWNLKVNNKLRKMLEGLEKVLPEPDSCTDVGGFLPEDPSYGHCDTCGAPCGPGGCTTDRGHLAAVDPTETKDVA